MVKAITAINVSKDIRVQEPQKMKSGAGYLCKIESPEIQLPRMNIPWNIGVKQGLNGGAPNCKLAVKFNNQADKLDGNHLVLKNLLDDMDEMAIKYLLANKKTVFNKPKSEAVIRETFTSSVKADPNGKYNPTFSAKVDFELRDDRKRARLDDLDDLSVSHKMNIGCFTRNGESLTPEDVLTKDGDIQAVIVPRHIWVTASGMGITYHASRYVVHKTSGGAAAFDFDFENIEEEQEGDVIHDQSAQRKEVSCQEDDEEDEELGDAAVDIIANN